MDKQIGLKKYVYEIIRSRIIHGVYEPGMMIYEQALTQELEVSRTPVREALNKIEQEGFIRIMPKKGVMVKEITVADVGEIFQVREEMEPVIVRLAGPYLDKGELERFKQRFESEPELPVESLGSDELPLDTQFHLYIIDNCHNSFFKDFMKKIFDRNTQLVIFSKQHKLNSYDARPEHLEIIRLLLEDKYEQAGEVMRQHVIRNRSQLLERLLHYHLS